MDLAKRLSLGFPLLADPDLAVINAWGVRMSGADIAVPSTFLVDGDRQIRWRYTGENQADRPSTDELIKQVLELR